LVETTTRVIQYFIILHAESLNRAMCKYIVCYIERLSNYKSVSIIVKKVFRILISTGFEQIKSFRPVHNLVKSILAKMTVITQSGGTGLGCHLTKQKNLY